MIGRNHLVIALALAGANLAILLEKGLVGVGAASIFLFGLAVGSLLPDVDAGDARIFHGAGRWFRKLDWLFIAIGRLTQFVIYLPLMVFGRGEHRGIMHSLSGAVASSVFWGIVVFAAKNALSLNEVVLFAAPGLFAGYFLHLVCDSFTRSGVAWLAPFSARRVCGQATTGKLSEELTALGFLALAAAIYLVSKSQYAAISQSPFLLVPAITAMLVAAYFFTASGFLRVTRLIPGFS